jgi:hypothetical protein
MVENGSLSVGASFFRAEILKGFLKSQIFETLKSPLVASLLISRLALSFLVAKQRTFLFSFLCVLFLYTVLQ